MRSRRAARDGDERVASASGALRDGTAGHRHARASSRGRTSPAPPGDTAEERAEALAERLLPDRTQKLRMLVIVNPYATTVSDRLKNLVVYALQARYQVEAIETEGSAHATEVSREDGERYDVVVAFGGDGTVNEAANGLVGSDTALTVLPGGSTNAYCRVLGIPNDVVDATEHLLAIADDFRPRRVDLGRVNGRHFLFASGAGLDATIVERIDRRPGLKARARDWFYAYAAVSGVGTYLRRPPRMRVELNGTAIDAVTVIAQNADPYTFFGSRPIRVCEGVALDSGSISLATLEQVRPLDVPALLRRVVSSSAAAVQRHRRIEELSGVHEARVVATDDQPFPVHVDGGYLGVEDEVAYGVNPGALCVVA